jgi:hypothetical protein
LEQHERGQEAGDGDEPGMVVRGLERFPHHRVRGYREDRARRDRFVAAITSSVNAASRTGA